MRLRIQLQHAFDLTRVQRVIERSPHATGCKRPRSRELVQCQGSCSAKRDNYSIGSLKLVYAHVPGQDVAFIVRPPAGTLLTSVRSSTVTGSV